MAVTETNERVEMEGGRSVGLHDTSLRANWRVIAFTFYIGMSLFEYGYDKGAIAGFQAMPGFLKVFGYQNPDGTWAIEVDFCIPFSLSSLIYFIFLWVVKSSPTAIFSETKFSSILTSLSCSPALNALSHP